MCFVWIWEQTAIIFLYSINWVVCITETECVYCAVRTECLCVEWCKLIAFLKALILHNRFWHRVYRCAVNCIYLMTLLATHIPKHMSSNEWRWTLQHIMQGSRHGLIQSTMVDLPGGPEEYHTNSIRTVCGLQEFRTGHYITQGRSSLLCDVVQTVASQRSELSSSVFWPDDGPCGCVLQFSLGSASVQFCRYTATFRKNMLPPSSGLQHWFHLDAGITAVRFVQCQDRGQSEPRTELTTSWFPRPEDWGSMFLRNVDVKSQKTPSQTWEVRFVIWNNFKQR